MFCLIWSPFVPFPFFFGFHISVHTSTYLLLFFLFFFLPLHTYVFVVLKGHLFLEYAKRPNVFLLAILRNLVCRMYVGCGYW